MEIGVSRDDGWIGIVEVDGECADVRGEVGMVGEKGDEGEVLGVSGEGEMAIEDAGGAGIEEAACARDGGEGAVIEGEGGKAGVDELDGEREEGHEGCEGAAKEKTRKKTRRKGSI